MPSEQGINLKLCSETGLHTLAYCNPQHSNQIDKHPLEVKYCDIIYFGVINPL